MINELSQMCVNGVDYELKDSVARQNMIAVTDAKVGQTIKIAEVDSNGIPVAWEAVEFPSEDAYELLHTRVIEEPVTTVSVNKYSDGTKYKLKKIFAMLKFPLLSEQYTTGVLEITLSKTSGGVRAYGAYGGTFNVPVHATRYFQMTILAEVNNGIITGRNNMSVIDNAEHAQRNNGPFGQYIGDDYISNVLFGVANGIPAGSTIEIYGVRA